MFGVFLTAYMNCILVNISWTLHLQTFREYGTGCLAQIPAIKHLDTPLRIVVSLEMAQVPWEAVMILNIIFLGSQGRFKLHLRHFIYGLCTAAIHPKRQCVLWPIMWRKWSPFVGSIKLYSIMYSIVWNWDDDISIPLALSLGKCQSELDHLRPTFTLAPYRFIQ